jgi:predicted O-linked N-acetylglucosamine transferase (SPINDLY family)
MWHRRFVDGGIAAERLDMGPFDDRLPDAQFSIHDEVDICLDPLGYNGTTTTCQALWMGVPVIVEPGRAHAACVGASIMTAAGLPEFVARDPEDALERIAALAADRQRLAAYRATLRDTLRASPLCDAKGFARDFEDKLRVAWREWCRSA